jgi:hypothetical protein
VINLPDPSISIPPLDCDGSGTRLIFEQPRAAFFRNMPMHPFLARNIAD